MPRPDMRPIAFNRLVLNLRPLDGRELVIVGASLLELALEVALARRMTTINADEHRSLFSDRGALASLSAKIAVAQGIGLISRKTRRELDHVRRLRNHVAHSWDELTLDDPACLRFVDQFGYVDRLSVEYPLDAPPTVEMESATGGFRFHEEEFRYDELDVITDAAGFVGFFVPTVPDGELTATQKVQHEICSCILAVVFPGPHRLAQRAKPGWRRR